MAERFQRTQYFSNTDSQKVKDKFGFKCVKYGQEKKPTKNKDYEVFHLPSRAL